MNDQRQEPEPKRESPMGMEDLAFPSDYGGATTSSSAPPRADAAQDTARLDWLTREGHCLMYYGVGPDGVPKWDVPDWGVQPSPRAAIDLARADHPEAAVVDPSRSTPDEAVTDVSR